MFHLQIRHAMSTIPAIYVKMACRSNNIMSFLFELKFSLPSPLHEGHVQSDIFAWTYLYHINLFIHHTIIIPNAIPTLRYKLCFFLLPTALQ